MDPVGVVDDRLMALMLQVNSSEEQRVTLPIEECEDLFGLDFLSSLRDMQLHENVTCLRHAPTLTQANQTKSIVLLILAVLSLIGNVVTMYSIHKNKRRRTGHIYTLLFHLSIADLFVTFWCILGDAIWYITVEWALGNIECKLFKFFQMFSLYLSTFIMVLIGVDRYIAVKYPLKSMSKGLCFKLIICCWTFAAVLSTPQMYVFHILRGPFQENFYQCVTYGSYSALWQETMYTLFTLAFTFVIPLTIMASAYLLTVCTLHRNEEFLDNSGSFRTLIDPNRRKLIRRAKMKSLRISVAIVAAFAVCWTPYYILMVITIVNRYTGLVNMSEETEDTFSTVIFFFGEANSLCNPIIYGIFHVWKPRRTELQRRDSSGKTQLTNLGSIKRQSRTASIVNGMGLTTLGQSIMHESNGHSIHHNGNGHCVNGTGRPNRVSVTSNGKNGIVTTLGERKSSFPNGASTNNNNNKSIII